MKKNMLYVLSAIAIMASAAPQTSDLCVRQMWPWSGKIRVSFVLSGCAGDDVQLRVEAVRGGTSVEIPQTALAGDLYAVKNGPKTIWIDPSAVPALSGVGTIDDLAVNVVADDTCGPVLYKMIDLTKNAGEAGQVLYYTESMIKSSSYGAYVENPIEGVESVAWTAPAANVANYAGRYLLMRRIKGGTFMWGKSVSVTLSPYWIAVFLTTRQQVAYIQGAAAPSDPTKPHTAMNYNALRGQSVEVNGVACTWPQSGHAVTANSLIGLLRQKTGMDGFDLATDAQWEYACRAGTDTTYFYNSNDSAKLSEYAVYGGGSAKVVGTKKPNAWGLYDMLGNNWEWVLDWDSSVYTAGLDPTGPASATSGRRTKRGGAAASGAANCTSFKRLADGNCAPNTSDTTYCSFRFVQNGF